MNLTKELKGWLVANCDVKEDASDEDFRDAAGKAMASGNLSGEKYLELLKPKESDEANVFSKKLDTMADNIKDLTEVLKQKEVKTEDTTSEKKTEDQTKKKKMEDMTKMIGEQGGTPTEPGLPDIKQMDAIFSTTKTAMMYPSETKGGNPHPYAGQPVVFQERSLDTPSDLNKACAGAWAKLHLALQLPQVCGPPNLIWDRLPEIDKQLIHHLCEKGEWDETEKDNQATPRLTKGYRGGTKQLIDDVLSGGLEAAPIVFDDQVIEPPLLKGELYPRIKEIVLPRGRRVEGVAVGRVTGGWGGVDAVAIALFATAGYVAAFDTTIFRWEGAFQVGLDFMSDTPIDFGGTITRQYGEQLLNDLDDVIATGNGIIQPQGMMNAPATTVVAFGGATTLGAYETMFFSVVKAERKINGPSVFCGTETSYSRARGMNVTAADQRRLGGGEANQGSYDSYKWMGRDYAINESLTNNQIFYFLPKGYRMYRRKGFAVRSSTEGQTLILANELLITVMARYGGQNERGATAAVTITAPV